MVFDMSFFGPLEDGEFDRAYERYCQYLKENMSNNGNADDAAREDGYDLLENTVSKTMEEQIE